MQEWLKPKLRQALRLYLSLICSEDSEDKDVKTKKDDSHSAGTCIVLIVHLSIVSLHTCKSCRSRIWDTKEIILIYFKSNAASAAVVFYPGLG